MNTWVRRSLEASIVAAGFVVIGAGVANAAEPAHAAGLPNADVTHAASGLVGTVTKTAHELTGGTGVTKQHATPAHVAKQRSTRRVTSAHTLPAHTLPGHHSAVHSVTGLVHRTADGLLGQRQAHPMRHQGAAHKGVKAMHVAKTVSVSRAVDVAPIAGNLASTLNGVGDSTLDLSHPTRPAGSLDLSGTGEAIGTVTADLGHAGALYGMTDTFGAVDVIAHATGNLHKGNVNAIGVADALVSSYNEVGGNLGDAGSIDGTLGVDAVGNALVAATGSLAHGDASGVLSATGAPDVAATLNGALGDFATVNSAADVSGFVDATLAAAADLRSGDVWAAGTLLADLDSSLDANAWLSGVGTVSVTGTLSAFLEGTLVTAGNLHSGHLSVVPSADGSLDEAVARAVANLDDGSSVADVTGDLSGRSISL